VIRIRGSAFLGWVVALVLAAGCGPSISDTGHLGLWRRASGAAKSEVAFWRGPDGAYRFRANRWSQDGTHALRCGLEGPCLEYSGAEPFYEYHYRVFERSGEDGLFVECDGRPRGAGNATTLHQIEQFTLDADRRSLEVRLVEQNHVPRDATIVRARFDKVSDDPN